MTELPGVRGLHAHPLAGSPVGRLLDDTTRRLASGAVPRCPHPDEPVFWYLSTGMLLCGPCAQHDAGAAAEPAACHLCQAPASAVAAWVTGGVPCLVELCEACHSGHLVPITPN